MVPDEAGQRHACVFGSLLSESESIIIIERSWGNGEDEEEGIAVPRNGDAQSVPFSK